jgi:hypothetical protein
MFFFSIILDGEMLVWDPVSERNLPFGTLKTAALGESYRPQITLHPDYLVSKINLRRNTTLALVVSL